MLGRIWILTVGLVLGLSSFSSSSDKPMTTEEVHHLLTAGVSEEVILSQIKTTDSVFELSVEEIIKLKKAGASDELIMCMIETGIEPESEAEGQPERVCERVYCSAPVSRHYVHYPYVLRPVVYYPVPSVSIKVRYHRPRHYPRRYRQTRYVYVHKDRPDPRSSRKIQAHRRKSSFADPGRRTFRRRWRSN